MALDFPSSPIDGQAFGNFVWAASPGVWKAKPNVSTVVVNSSTAPTSATAGDLWMNTSDGTMYVYYNDGTSSQWIESRAPITADGYYSPNYVINGAMDIWQRGTTGFGNGYNADRWYMGGGSGGVAAVSRQSFDTSVTAVPTDISYYLRHVQTTSATSATPGIRTYIENVKTLSKKTVTMSFYAKASKNISVSPLVRQMFGTGGTPSAQEDTYFYELAQTVTTTWARYSTTFTVPDISSKIMGTDTNSSIIFQFLTPLNDTYTFDITGVQIEEGFIATPFRRNAPSIQAELAACKRYYQRYSGAVGCGLVGVAHITTGLIMNFSLNVDMRATPVIFASGGIQISDQYVTDQYTSAAVASSLQGANTTGGRFTLTGFTGLTVGRWYSSPSTYIGAGYLDFSAEL